MLPRAATARSLTVARVAPRLLFREVMRSVLFPLFCVGAASATAGGLLSSVLAAALAPGAPPAPAESAPPPEPVQALDGLRLAALLRLPERARDPEPTVGFADFRLRGTLSPALACVEPAAGGGVRSVAAGDRLGDALVEEVGHGFITLRTAGGLARLAVGAPPASVRVAPSSAPTHTVELPRAELGRLRSQLPLLAAQVRVVPAFESGEAVGFRIAWLAADAVALRAGLRAGDVVTAINGHRLTDTESVLALAREVQTGTHFTADIVRSGATLRLEVRAN